MNEPTVPPDVVDDGMSDVMAEGDVVHVPPGAVELAESLEEPASTFAPEVPHWDDPDPHAPQPPEPEPEPEPEPTVPEPTAP
jgi:hypothetical protein